MSDLRLILFAQGVISLLGTGLTMALWGRQHALSFAAGAGMVLTNWIFLGASWSWVLGKKPIALATTVIVIKYALFGLGCIFIARQRWVDPSSLLAGFATVIPAILYLTVRRNVN